MNEKNILIKVQLDENKIASRLNEIKTAINGLEKDNQKLKVAMDELGDSSGNFSRAIETNNNKIKSLQSEYTKLESKLSNSGKATQNLAKKTSTLSKAEDKLSSSVANSNTNLNTNQKELNEVGNSLNETEASTNKLASSQEKLGNSFTNSASKIQDFNGELTQSNMGLKKAESNLEEFDDGFANVGNQASNFSGILNKIIGKLENFGKTIGIVSAGGAASIQKATTGIKAISKASKHWIAVIVVAAILLIGKLTKVITENQALLRGLANFLDVTLEPIIKALTIPLEYLAKGIGFICDKIALLIRLTFNLQDAFLKEEQRLRSLIKAVEDLNDSKRKYAVDEEERSLRIAQLTKIVNDEELKSVDERIAAQEELNRLKEESLVEAEDLAKRELANFKETNQARIDELEELKKKNGELTEAQKEELEDLKDNLNKLDVDVRRISNAIIMAESDAKDSIVSIITDLTTEEIRERLTKLKAEKEAHDAEMAMLQERQNKLDAENKQIDTLMKKVAAKTSLEEAVLFLRERGINVLEKEENQWDAIYRKLLSIRRVGVLEIKPTDNTKGEDLQKKIDEYTEALERSIKRNTITKIPTIKTKTEPEESEEEKQRKKEAEELAKYWAKVLDESEKGLSAFLGEIRQADKEFRELSMNPIEIFDMNLDESLKALDARKAEIQAKIFEIQNTKTNTDEEKEQQEAAIRRYTQMYAEFESLRTAITQKAAKERAKLEEEMTKENLEHRLTEIERYYKRQKEEAMMEGSYEMAGGGTSFFFSGIDNVASSKMELEQAKDELVALQEALKELPEGSEAYEEMADRIVEANMKIIESEKQVIDSVLEGAMSYINAVDQISGSISSLMSAKKKEVQNSKKSEAEKAALIKEIEDKERGMAVAQIAFSTASSIASVVADAAKAGWPAMIPILIAGIATVISGIAQAKSAMAGYQEGGVIPGNSYTGDKLMIRANSDEMVLTKKQQTELFNIANGRGGNGNQFYMVRAFEKALSKMPSPTLEYSEFSTFTKSVNSMNNLVRIK